MKKKMKTQPPLVKTVGKISDFYDKESVYWRDKKTGDLYIGVPNVKENFVTIISKISFDGARHETITILKSSKRYAL